MAYDTSTRYQRSIAFPHLPHLHALIALQKPIRYARRVLRTVSSAPRFTKVSDPVLTDSLEGAAVHYREHHWAFMEYVFTPEFHAALLSQFPRRRYMEPPKTIYKSYDIGFQWERGRGGGKHLSLHPAYEALHDYFCSEAFSKRITLASGSSSPLSCRTFLVNRTYPGSLVIAHKDSPIPKEFTPYINMVFFLEATGGERSGALILARDNEYRDVVFDPPVLRNSCLMYDTEAPLYHGFKPIAWGKHRLALTASFARSDYVPRSSE